MAEFIFITGEGFTTAPNGHDVENFQVLGFESGSNMLKAKANLYKNNSWIEEGEFSEENITCYELTDKTQRLLITKVLDYLWKDEQHHYEENPVKNHIYLILKKLKKLM